MNYAPHIEHLTLHLEEVRKAGGDVDTVADILEIIRTKAKEEAPTEAGFREMETRFLERWRRLPEPFPKIRGWSAKRRRELKARLREKPFRDCWEIAMDALPDSPFHRGENERGWVANVTWFLRPDKVVAFVEQMEADNKITVAASEGPPGWRAFYQDRYGETPPDSWEEVPEERRDRVRQKMEE